MPMQTSKYLSVTLFNDEVDVWEKIEAIIVKRRQGKTPLKHFKKPILGVIFRDLLQIAATQLADEIGPETAQQLSLPRAPSNFEVSREIRRQEQLAAKALAPKSKAKTGPKKVAPKAPPKPTHRIAWNRPPGRNRRVIPKPGDSE